MNRLRRWAKRLKQDTYALYLAAKHPRVPRAAKVLASIVLAYALSPVDLIPDFIPVLGLLDDLILVPLGVALVIWMIPQDVWEACRAEAGTRSERLPPSRVAAFVIVSLWLTAGVVAVWFVWARVR